MAEFHLNGYWLIAAGVLILLLVALAILLSCLRSANRRPVSPDPDLARHVQSRYTDKEGDTDS